MRSVCTGFALSPFTMLSSVTLMNAKYLPSLWVTPETSSLLAMVK